MDIKLKKAQQIKINKSEDLYKVMREIFLYENEVDQKREHLWVCGLDYNKRLIYIELVYIGTSNFLPFDNKEFFETIIYKDGIVAIIPVHNHPSGKLKPSKEDLEVTTMIMKTGELLGYDFIDHLIISKDSFYSLRDSGDLDSVEFSLFHALPNEIYTRIVHRKKAANNFKKQVLKYIEETNNDKKMGKKKKEETLNKLEVGLFIIDNRLKDLRKRERLLRKIVKENGGRLKYLTAMKKLDIPFTLL